MNAFRHAMRFRIIYMPLMAIAVWGYFVFTHSLEPPVAITRLLGLESIRTYMAFRFIYQLSLGAGCCYAFWRGSDYLYRFTRRFGWYVESQPLPLYPLPEKRKQLFLIAGETHHPTKAVPVENPRWLVLEDYKLRAGIAVLGGSQDERRNNCLLPFAEQLIGFKPENEQHRLGGLVLDTTGELSQPIRALVNKYDREEDCTEIGVESGHSFNPLRDDTGADELASAIVSVLANDSQEPRRNSWQKAASKFFAAIIRLERARKDWVTFCDLYKYALAPEIISERIEETANILDPTVYVRIAPEVYGDADITPKLRDFAFQYDEREEAYLCKWSQELENTLHVIKPRIPYCRLRVGGTASESELRRQSFAGAKEFLQAEWPMRDEAKRKSVTDALVEFLKPFAENPQLKRTFCPEKNQPKILPSFRRLLTNGEICLLQCPNIVNPGIGRLIGVLAQIGWQSALRGRTHETRPAFLICNEFQKVTYSEKSNQSGSSGDRKCYRNTNCIGIISLPHIPAIQAVLPEERWRNLLQEFSTNIFLSLTDKVSSEMASAWCGVDAQTKKPRFQPQSFTKLKANQSIVLRYNGLGAPATLCYLKPANTNPNVSYFQTNS